MKKISNRDENGAVRFVCASTEAVSTWHDSASALCPEGYGAGSEMTVIDYTATPPEVTGFGFYDGSDWATM